MQSVLMAFYILLGFKSIYCYTDTGLIKVEDRHDHSLWRPHRSPVHWSWNCWLSVWTNCWPWAGHSQSPTRPLKTGRKVGVDPLLSQQERVLLSHLHGELDPWCWPAQLAEWRVRRGPQLLQPGPVFLLLLAGPLAQFSLRGHTVSCRTVTSSKRANKPFSRGKKNNQFWQ